MLRLVLAWDDLRVFLAVNRTRSHAAAARSLRVAATTIGRRMLALEQAVGARLFTRSPEGLVATAAARALLARAERVEAEVLEAERELSGADARPTGTVRITCGEGFAMFALAPALPRFLAAHPGLLVEVRADARALDLARGEADVALRSFRPRERSLVGRRLGVERYGLYASEGYLRERGAPRKASELTNHDLLIYDAPMDKAFSAQAWLLRLAAPPRRMTRINTTTAMHAACAAGAGIAILNHSYLRPDAPVKRVLPDLDPPTSEMWALTHPDLRSAARVAAALKWLEELVREGGHDR
ncbi:MAG TPA: LysR family transcriptional regulator [Anaeromyxobacteraceae bacterium]|nr:LysR family transcriptional regulator [Anaeromyxobacteraceae bacterium]